MKKTLLLIVLTLAVSLSFGQTVTSDSEVTAEIAKQALQFTLETPVDFGVITRGVVVNLDETSTASHTGVTGATVGHFIITGEEGESINIDYDASVLLENSNGDQLTFAPEVVGDGTTPTIVHANAGVINSAGSTVNLNGSAFGGGTGSFEVWVGGGFGGTVSAAQPRGVYSATTAGTNFTLNVTYN